LREIEAENSKLALQLQQTMKDEEKLRFDASDSLESLEQVSICLSSLALESADDIPLL
jgi:hypothetical protein